MARPEIQFSDDDIKAIGNYAGFGATDDEIGAIFNCSGQTIRRRFVDVLTKARSTMKLRLRQVQYRKAISGNVTMMIWLGKQMLGQSEKVMNVNVEADSESDLARRILNDDDARRIADEFERRMAEIESSFDSEQADESKVESDETSRPDFNEDSGVGLPIDANRQG